MAEISAKLVKELRDATDCGMMDCKKALAECNGDLKKAAEYLQIKGLAKAAKRGARKTSEGFIGVYRHHDGKGAVMVEVNCETDFVARTDNFRDFCKELALHIYGLNPLGVTRDQIDPAIVEEQRKIFTSKAAESGKPEAMLGKIVDGMMNKWFAESCLLDQIWMGEGKETVEMKRASISASTGENVRIRRFMRLVVGEGVTEEAEQPAE